MRKQLKSKNNQETPEPNIETNSNPEVKEPAVSVQRVEVVSKAEQPGPEAEEPMEEGIEINKLIDQGFSVKQIITLGFNRRTAYHYAKLRMKPENDPSNEADSLTKNATIMAGKHELMKLGARDVIPPESIVDAMVFPKDGSALEVWKQGYSSCLWQVLGVARLLQVLSAGQADIVTSQLQLWQEARGSSKEMAQEAAHQAANETAEQLAQYLDRKLEKAKEPAPAAETPTIADRMLGPMADVAGKQMASMFGNMFGSPAKGSQVNPVKKPKLIYPRDGDLKSKEENSHV
jgi:hypothetical protein